MHYNTYIPNTNSGMTDGGVAGGVYIPRPVPMVCPTCHRCPTCGNYHPPTYQPNPITITYNDGHTTTCKS